MTIWPTVRRSTPADLAGIRHLIRMAHAETGAFNLSERKIDWVLDRVIHPERILPEDAGLRGYIGVIGPTNALEGLILLVISTNWYTDDFHLEEFVNFVHPDHRQSNHAKTLIGYAKHLSDKVGIPLMIGVISNKRTEAKVRLYRRLLPVAGAFFLYNADTNKVRVQPRDENPGSSVLEQTVNKTIRG